ncbi:MAG: class I SAM-dependent methyltransferase [Cyclobacteriaceae bacterium]|nr:class I SAM-dependent methyltransferase [Cyclobacteriaceae bacterium]
MKSRYLAIFFISAATLLLELSLTRILSIAFYYHFGFLVISTALLGFGISGTAISMLKAKIDTLDQEKLLFWLSIGFSLSAVASYLLCQTIGFNPFQIFDSTSQLFLFPVYNIILAAPFFFTGLIIALLFTYSPDTISKLYAWDLLGAGLGCGLTTLILPLVGGVGAIFIVAFLGFITAFCFSGKIKAPMKYAPLLVGLAFLFFAPIAENSFPITVTEGKSGEDTQNAPIYSRWNSMSKIEVFEMGPGERGSRYPDSLRLIRFDEGTAATEILDLRPDASTYLQNWREKATLKDSARILTSSAFVNKAHPKVFIIGSGGGEEVFASLVFNASKIDAVEINPLINEIVTRDMADFAGHLQDQKGVTFHTEDARTFINKSNEIYDVIISIHTISKAAIASGAMSLAEDYVLTKDAFEQYWNHLSPEGTLFFTRPDVDIPKFATTLRTIMDEHGVKDPENHFFVFKGGFVFKKSAFSIDDINKMERLRGFASDSVLREKNLVYSPFDFEADNVIRSILTTDDLTALYQDFDYKIEPATDDQPFFSHKFRWSKLSWDSFINTFQTKDNLWGNLELKPIAEYVLIVILLQTILVAGIMILLPLFTRSKSNFSKRKSIPILLYFSGLGLGFIMIEMALLQKYQLYIGQPIYTYAIILGSILIASGLGSYYSKIMTTRYANPVNRIIPLIILLLLLYYFFIPVLFHATLYLSLELRLLIAAVSIFPLGFMLGMPFPTGLAHLGSSTQIIPWAWGVNSFFTVIGTTIALILGMALGFSWVLFIAGGCYGVALLAINVYLKAINH